jgi:DNA processing protein
MNRLEALVALNLILDIGSIRLKKLLDVFEKPENILNASIERLVFISGIGQAIAQKIVSIKKEDVEKEFVSAERLDLTILSFESPDYPKNLSRICDPPIILYVKGKLSEDDNISLAIVGSRRASFYGLNSAENFARELAARGFTIVSGMARGIDTYSHRGALKSGGRTIAVIGSGFNNIYPVENKELAEEISKNGAVISELPVDSKPLKQNFPRRNRVISGLSLGVLVVEAAKNSGALITSDFALEQGRDVFALPGKIDSPGSFGTNGLIKQGAKLVSCPEDIIEEFPDLCRKIEKSVLKASPAPEKNKNESLSKKEALLYNMLSECALSMDDIIEKTDAPVAELSDTLLRLQIKRLIKQLPGRQFARN